MLTIFVVDRTASSRSRLIEHLQTLLSSGGADLDLLPRIELRSLAAEELKFHSTPDICIVGSEMLQHELTSLGKVREVLSVTPLVVELSRELKSVSIVEQLARLGADDTFHQDHEPDEFIRKLIVLSKRTKSTTGGKLVLVDSGKGGMGVTTITAALMELLAAEGKSVVGLDFDLESQDLSRFLGAKPFVNDNLELLFTKNRPVTEEFVDQALTDVLIGSAEARLMPPVPDGSYFYSADSGHTRVLISILEALDRMADVVVVDMASCVGAVRRTLYRFADECVLLLNNDPAVLFASVDKLTRVRGYISPNAQIRVLLNNTIVGGLAPEVVSSEFSRSVAKGNWEFLSTVIPHCKSGLRWPGSGRSLASMATSKTRVALKQLQQQSMACVSSSDAVPTLKVNIASRMLSKFISRDSVFSPIIMPGIQGRTTQLGKGSSRRPESPERLLIGPPQSDGPKPESPLELGDPSSESAQTEDILRKFVTPARLLEEETCGSDNSKQMENGYVEH